MSLPNYLQKIKSAGIYRFVFDKSDIPGEVAETLRLVVGYSEKGPFNTPVYIESPTDFKVIYGDVSKKLERNGIYFHRMALQALKAGPIIALNLKYFDESASGEHVQAFSFDVNESFGNAISTLVRDVYTTTRFWKLEPEHLEELSALTKYINITATDSKETSCSVFMRGYQPSGYDVTLNNWYSSVLNGKELPEFMQNYGDTLVSQYFAEIYVFRGEFTPAIATSEALAKYFKVNGTSVTLKPYITNAFGEKIDTLAALADNEASNFVNNYAGILIPDFQDANGAIISLDGIFNADHDNHKMMMRLNQSLIYDSDSFVLSDIDTTGWLNGIAGSSMMSAVGITPSSMVFTSNGTSWTITDSNENANYYNYVFSNFTLASDGKSFTTTDSLSGVVINQSDRFVGVDGKIATITSISSNTTENEVDGETVTTTTTTITFDNAVYNSSNGIYKCNTSVSATCENCSMTPTYIQGYTRSTTYAKPAANTQIAKLNWIKDAILAALTNYNGLRIGLTSNIDVEYHYIVDTFDSYVENECKSMLSSLARQKDNCILLANFPKMKTFELCDYTSFTDAQGNFSTKYVAQGGNKQKPIGMVFTLPTEENGASWSAFYTQVIIRDPATGIKYTCPSAALVSNCFMDKYQNRQPYGIVAGPDFSRLQEPGLIGPDFNFCREDLDNLEPMGCNCIVYAPRKGVYVNGNQSAKQNPVTTLSSINVRECVIYIQDEVHNILQAYQWWTNNADLRAKIKAKVDYLLENVKQNGGIYDFNTVCDSSNNTDEIIDQGMFVIDVNIEAARGAGIMVQRLTLYRKGGIASLTIN